ncbi:hypothetical protein KL929_001575 [Ogataea haglerorum]|uniref:uncharacterized protein n=1 Tax=Ogataea haglerorum TaxID=1937702 RepID=UPI001C89CD20|nr:uncharacterized protein KL911_000334 [Ogataea haglerorum]KAG7700754.1 hypothetical protein KL951_000869 [Ogataea haglerorum]KAG7741023.1 hypothetical protein KL923_001664 [Ogataea haglerorum]KAG7748321.1 hypothetical protein KL912_002226 [Ogataea haglerorum]KAG7759197.1 hypothetical protein KL911_000334 [Ogataea haglerorum]KAG7791694.1 hypothetical protein KL910_001820 [Ogataea haglerorum]
MSSATESSASPHEEIVLDYLPYIDQEPSNDVLAVVDDLIQEELMNFNLHQLHPKLRNASVDLDNESRNLPITNEGIGGISLSSYSNLLNEQNEPDINKMKTALSYTQLRYRTLLLNSQESAQEINKNKWMTHLDNLKQHQEVLERAIDRKRRHKDEINEERKRQCTDFEPMNEYLGTRWTEKMEELIDIGVEAALQELEN